jgi:hypothetical protein
MKSYMNHAVALMSALVLGGCLQVHTVVTVNQDGSGTVKETLIFGRQLALMMRAFERMGDDEKKTEVFDEEKLRKEAVLKGEGVTYVSGKAITSRDGEGYEAVYAFKDISKLQLNQNPGGKFSGMGMMGTTSDSGDKKEILTFAFTRGTPATLVINMPERTLKEPDAKQDPEPTDDEEDTDTEMARMMLGDLRISTVVEVVGSIVETNASFRTGSRVTLVEIDFDKLLDDKEFLREARRLENVSKEEARRLMEKHSGLKFELNDRVRVRFRK